MWPITFQNFKRISGVNWWKRCTRFWTQFMIKMPYFWANWSLLSIFIIVTFIYLYSPTIMQYCRKNPNVDSENKMYRKVLVQFGINMSHLEAKKNFFLQYSLFSPLFTNKAQSYFKNSKLLGPKLTHGKNEQYWVTGHFFQKVISVTFFWNIKNFTTVCKIIKMLLGYHELTFCNCR